MASVTSRGKRFRQRANGETQIKTYEVRIREEDGTITSNFYVAENAEALFDHLSVLSDNLDIVGYNVVGG